MYPGLVSCPFYAIPIYPFKKFFIYLYSIVSCPQTDFQLGGTGSEDLRLAQCITEGNKRCPACSQLLRITIYNMHDYIHTSHIYYSKC